VVTRSKGGRSEIGCGAMCVDVVRERRKKETKGDMRDRRLVVNDEEEVDELSWSKTLEKTIQVSVHRLYRDYSPQLT
jgi:hypothetical protein